MKSKDRIKEEIGLYNLLLTVALAVFISLMSWMWNNSSASSIWSNIIIFIAIIMVSIFILIFLLTIDLKIKELDFYD